MINITSGISVLGIFISTAAMIIVLSGFNGIEELVKSLYSSFDPDVEAVPTEGKTFEIDDVDFKALNEIEGVKHVYTVVEEITMIKHDDRYAFATMKGVGPEFFETDLIKNNIIDGKGTPDFENENMVIMGYGLQGRLQVPTDEVYDNSVTVYGLLRTEKLKTTNQKSFKPASSYVKGIFNINPEFDNDYYIVPLDFAVELLEYENSRSKIEFVLEDGADSWQLKDDILNTLGPGFKAKTRYEQNELVFKTNEAEKWMVFLILGFIMLISTFNIIASLTMLILDKKKDIRTLISLGATESMIKRIFILEGLMINFVGAFLGALVGFGVCYAQVKFHLVTLENSVIDHWPVIVKWFDIGLIFGTVIVIGFTSSYLPVRLLVNRHFKGMFVRN